MHLSFRFVCVLQGDCAINVISEVRITDPALESEVYVGCSSCLLRNTGEVEITLYLYRNEVPVDVDVAQIFQGPNG